MRLVFVGLLIVSGACGSEDPVLKAAREAAEQAASVNVGPGTAEGSPVSGGHPIDGGLAMNPGSRGPTGEAGAITPGVPEEPTPGDPSSPSPGVPGSPTPGVPGSPTPGEAGQPEPGTPSEEVDEGPVAPLSGVIQMADYRTGLIRVDVFDGDHRSHAGQRPNLVRSVTLDRPGTFELSIPISVEKVWLESSNDENQDGRPGPRDPSGRYVRNPLSVDSDGASGLVIVLERNDPPPGGSGTEL